MGCIDLLLSDDNSPNLDIFSSRFFKALGILEFEKRENSNYAEGFYFIGKLDDFTIELCYTDDNEHADRPFWSIIDNRGLTDEEVAEFVDNWAKNLARLGFCLARVDGFGTKAEVRYNYSPDGTLTSKDTS